MSNGDAPIIIKKVKKGGGGGHHGGAWKVAYADFVTAMMAFFLLMWLINTTSPEQKRGIADYFAPASVSPTKSGSGGILAGTALGREGVRNSGSNAVVEGKSSNAPNPEKSDQNNRETNNYDASGTPPTDQRDNAAEDALSRREDAQIQSAEETLRQALQDMPELAELSKHIQFDVTPEGLRIQLVDQEGRPMFAPGSAEPLQRARVLLRAVSEIIEPLPNRVTIAGHTDAGAPIDPTISNWDLSTARAQSARRLLQQQGLLDDRIYHVAGKAASEPLFPDDPFQAANRRITIVLRREAPVVPPGLEF